MAAHAKLNASGSSRWISCPGSVRAEAEAPRGSGGGSHAAREGTAAHQLGTICLVEGVDAAAFLGTVIAVPLVEDDEQAAGEAEGVLVWPAGKAPKGEGLEKLRKTHDVFTVDDEMRSAVQVYLEFVWAQLDEFPGAELTVEERYDLNWVLAGAPGERAEDTMFGTSDAVVDDPFNVLCVTDYKHGRGVPVFIGTAKAPNTQVMYYAAGAAQRAGWSHERVRLAIVQPRCVAVPDVQVVEIPILQLKRWAENDLRAAALLTEDEDAMRVAGDQCRFCRVSPTCPTADRQAQIVARADFRSVAGELPVPTEADQLARAMAWLPFLDTWKKAVAGEVQRRLMLDPGAVPGCKLVRKKANRKYRDRIVEAGKDGEVEVELTDERLLELAKSATKLKTADLTTPPKLLSPAQLEKKGAKAKEFVKRYAFKPEGGLTVASDSDPREAAVPLSIEFAGVREEGEGAE